MRMRPIVLSYAKCLALPYFSTLSHKMQDLRKKLLKLKFFLLFSLQILSETFLILRRIQRDIVTNVRSIHVKYRLLMPDLNESRIVSRYIIKILKYQFSWKFLLWEQSCSCRQTYGRTDTTQLTVAFRNFMNAPVKGNHEIIYVKLNDEVLSRTLETLAWIMCFLVFWIYGDGPNFQPERDRILEP